MDSGDFSKLYLDMAEVAKGMKPKCFTCDQPLQEITWKGKVIERCIRCWFPELRLFRDALDSEDGKKVREILYRDHVVPPLGIPNRDEVMFMEGARSVIWEIERNIELANKLSRGAGEAQ